ncbi:FlgO family outer membrane protein [Spirochaetota bacterium]
MKYKVVTIILTLLLILVNNLHAEKIVGVTKFKNLTKNKNVNWLAEGIADAITNKLSKVKEFIVVDRTNVEKMTREISFGQSGLVDQKYAKKIGKALGANIIVIGNYAKYGKRVRISARLVEVESFKVLKQEQATGAMNNIWELMDEIALKLISSSNVNITKREIKRIKSDVRIKNLSAFEYYSKGKKFYINANYSDSIRLFKKAVDIEDNYNLAYAGLAKAYAALYYRKWKIFEKGKDQSLIRKSYKYAKKALKITPDLDEAHLSLARYYIYVDKKDVPKKWKYCEESTKKTLELNPNNAEAYYLMSRIYAYNDTKEERYLKKALSKNRFLVSAHLQLGIMYFEQKKYGLAERSLKKTIEIEPKYVLGFSWLGYMYNKLGQTQKAIDMYEEVLKKHPDYIYGYRSLGKYYRNLKRYDKAIEQFRKAIDLKSNDHQAWHEIGYVYQQKRDYYNAIKYYKKSLNYKSNYYYAFANMGYSYTQLSQYDNAIKYLRKAHFANYKKAWPAGYLGWIYRYKLKNNSQAKYWYGQAVKRDPKNAGYKSSLSQLQRKDSYRSYDRSNERRENRGEKKGGLGDMF